MRFILTAFLLTILINVHVIAQTSLPDFFHGLYTEHFNDYHALKNDVYRRFCNRFDLSMDNDANIHRFMFLYFLHDCFTGVNATDYSSGGFFKIPYFWHWVNPNPRHTIILLPDSIFLNQIESPREFAKYKSFADIDRVASLFLSDLVSVEPNYYHKNCGQFYTFGWCSEREMSFVLLLSIYGYEGKIKQSGIHTWSEFWIPFDGADGSQIILISNVDNTFDNITWDVPASDQTKEQWANDFGTGEQIEWYNKISRSVGEIQKVRDIVISNSASARLTVFISKSLK